MEREFQFEKNDFKSTDSSSMQENGSIYVKKDLELKEGKTMVHLPFFSLFQEPLQTVINMNKTTEREVVKYMSIRRYSVREGDPCINIQYSMNAPIVRMNLFQTGRGLQKL